MFSKINRIWIILPLMVLVGCQHRIPDSATIIWFDETETGVDPYRTRMLINKRFLRIDDGKDDGGYVLFDRKQGIINSVNPDDERILVIKKPEKSQKIDAILSHKVELQQDNPPKVSGKNVNHYKIITNDKQCYELFAAKGLLTAEVKALQEYSQLLATEHARLAASTPAELRSPCDLANHVTEADRHLRHGFPVMVLDMTGRMRRLRDYKIKQKVQAKLFRLPERYRRFSTGSVP